ncbi:hypothetical protein JXR93_05930 [bacterium]|nr:hypothetical protein [bacterium]
MKKYIVFLIVILSFFTSCGEENTGTLDVQTRFPSGYTPSRAEKMIISVGSPRFWLSDYTKENFLLDSQEFNYSEGSGKVSNIGEQDIQVMFEIKEAGVQENIIARGLTSVISSNGKNQTHYAIISPLHSFSNSLNINNSITQLPIGLYGHTATELPDGRVLIWGGFKSDGTATSDAYIFDPATHFYTQLSFTNTPVARGYHSATFFYGNTQDKTDPKVLIAGGMKDSNNYLMDLEIFDVKTETVTKLSQTLQSQKAFHEAVYLKGGSIIIIGGKNNLGAQSSIEMFNPYTNGISLWGTLPKPLVNMAVSSIGNDKIIIAGGDNGSDVNKNVYLLTFNNEELENLGELTEARTSLQSVFVNDDVYFIGGFKSVSNTTFSQASGTVEKINLTTRVIQKLSASLSNPRGEFTATLLSNNNIAVIGGHDGNRNPVGDMELIWNQVGKSKPTTTATMITPRFGHKAIHTNTGIVIVIGGKSFSIDGLTATEFYTAP